MLILKEEVLKIKKAKSIIADTFPWQHEVFKLVKEVMQFWL